jgi:hypothetical protein
VTSVNDLPPTDGDGRAAPTRHRAVPSQLFVIDGDLNRLRCAAVLVPTDRWGGLSGSFDDLLDEDWFERVDLSFERSAGRPFCRA